MFIRSGRIRNALVVGTDVLSRFLDWQDRSTCILFGDGAGAAVVGVNNDGADRGILSSRLQTDGSYAETLYIRAGGSKKRPPRRPWRTASTRSS